MNFVKRAINSFRRSLRKQNEIYWGLVFNNAISDSTWLKRKSFYPGRWAAGYPLLYILYRIYNDIKPKSIVEFGLGETTKLSAQYQQYFPETFLTIFEQDNHWADFFCKEHHNVRNHLKIAPMEQITVHGRQSSTYKDFITHLSGRKFDLFIVDGPHGSDHYSRYHIVEIAKKDIMNTDFIFVIDDYDRNGEKQTVGDLRDVFRSRGILFHESVYSGDNDSLLICSPKYSFLTSL